VDKFTLPAAQVDAIGSWVVFAHICTILDVQKQSLDPQTKEAATMARDILFAEGKRLNGLIDFRF
jgi:hypothetical protein